ncbi:acyltransferase [Ordospora pajunii]|uniref:acyltransferase n=1 Tax=Ordospora pajunii TaxID=3039483 RepID=UPI00295269B5|nr:acyltransferase [Ordospora pajunii]KAH9411448.1 acyltransferase [Ordospora pajunii]
MIRKAWSVLSLVAIVTVYFSYITVTCGLIFVVDLMMPRCLSRDAIVKAAKVAWLSLTKAALHGYFPGKVFIRYDPAILDNRRNIVISNHLTEYDWLFISCVMHHFRRFGCMYIILKMSLKDIPLLGYGMRFFEFIFLNRRLSKDKELIMSGASNLKKKTRYDLLLFPEGTYIDKVSHEKSHEWARSGKTMVDGHVFDPEEVILPRTTGFDILRANMKDDMDGILDITIIGNPYVKYPNDVFSYREVLVNKSCMVNFMFFLDYIPSNDGMDSKEFLLRRFERKEKMIRHYKEIQGCDKIQDMEEFRKVADLLCDVRVEYKDVEIDLSSRWGPLFYAMFVFVWMVAAGWLARWIWK